MRKRKLSRKGSKSLFTATASKTRGVNIMMANPMRGGFRL